MSILTQALIVLMTLGQEPLYTLPKTGDPICFVRVHQKWSVVPKDWQMRLIHDFIPILNDHSGKPLLLGGSAIDRPDYSVWSIFADCKQAEPLMTRIYEDFMIRVPTLSGENGINAYHIGPEDLCPDTYFLDENGERPIDHSQINFETCAR